MGASESSLATPTCKPLLNKHLEHVNDPRSPTAGILRTPIEVISSPQESPLPGFSKVRVVASDQNLSWDPRSPTPGVSRTPMKDTVDCLVKQLSEAFVADAMEENLLLEESHHQGQKSEDALVVEEASREETSSGEASQGSTLWSDERNKQVPSGSSVSTARPTHSAKVLCPTENKPTRRRTNGKMLVMSAGAGRLPLGILRGDNSPTSLTFHQSKRNPSLADNQGEYKEGVLSSGRSLKAGNCTWDSFNKENQQCHLVEN